MWSIRLATSRFNASRSSRKQREIRLHLHRCVHGAYVSRRRKGSGYGDARVTMVEASPHGKTRKLLTPPALFPIFDGEAEAKLIALACGPAPAGRAKWTLRLLEEKVVELQIVESASDNTIGRT